MKKIILPMIVIAFVSCNLVTQSNSEPVVINTPISNPSSFETNDSSFLKIKIQGNKFEIDFLKNISEIDNIDKLDSFIQKNKQLINKEKVVLSGFDTTKINKNLNDLFLKHGITKLRISRD